MLLPLTFKTAGKHTAQIIPILNFPDFSPGNATWHKACEGYGKRLRVDAIQWQSQQIWWFL
jgi:hypothetical protein